MKDRIVIALDVSSREKAVGLVHELHDLCAMFKVGSQLYMSAGPAIIREIIDGGGKVFLDLKFHDIPTTVTRAATEAAKLGVSMMTVHASGGRAMMQSVSRELHDNFPAAKPLVLAVTVLTSMNPALLAEIGIPEPIEQSVRRLAMLAEDCGMGGIVCSPREVELVRRNVRKDFKILTPGIRMPNQSLDDQHRTATPRQAIADGADYIVVGRAVTGEADPRAAMQRLMV